MPTPNLTERPQKWFQTVRTGLERDTGKTLDEWSRSPGPLPGEVDAEIAALLKRAWDGA